MSKFINRTNETRLMSNGQEATIIVYRNNRDADIKFEDGTIVKHRLYKEFLKGAVANPNYKYNAKSKRSEEKHIGETKTMSNGQKAVIIEYRNIKDVDIKFEDGTIVEHQKYGNFNLGYIVNPNCKRIKTDDYLYETRTMTNGQKATIVAYRRYDDIDIQFEDGTVVEHKRYSAFLSGYIKNPNCETIKVNENLKNSRLGETRNMQNGQKATIIAYRRAVDIDVKFEDGMVFKHKNYSNFKNGNIANPNSRLGETRTMTNGQKATIVAYRRCDDIDIQFEDGTVVKRKKYKRYKKGRIANPNCVVKTYRVGETNIMLNGQKAKIIKYRSANDLDVQFEDGTVVEHKSYPNFQKGGIGNPKLNVRIKQAERLGETLAMNNGQKATVIAYHCSDDIDVQFEDGTIVEHKCYNDFQRKSIANPNLLVKKICHPNNYVTRYAFTKEEKVYYNVHCDICGLDEIWTPQQMLEHRKKCN